MMHCALIVLNFYNYLKKWIIFLKFDRIKFKINYVETWEHSNLIIHCTVSVRRGWHCNISQILHEIWSSG